MIDLSKHRKALSMAFVAMTIVMSAATIMLTTAYQQAYATSEGVFAPDSSPYGKTYGQWTADWWTWAFNTTFAAFDNAPESCNVGQTDPDVFFLAGTFGGSAVRDCTISEEKAIMFPIINALCGYTGKAPDGKAPDGNPVYVKRPSIGDVNLCGAAMNNVISKEASVDGIAIEDLNEFRFKSGVFELPIGPDGQSVKLVSDGYWVILEPLPPGEYEIHFKGVSRQGHFFTEVTYNITVE